MEKYLLIGACACAVIGATWDVASRRIPNWLTYGAFLAGLLLRFCFGGFAGGMKSTPVGWNFGPAWHQVLYGLAGGLIGGGIFFLFYLVKGMGMGDVKLMAAVGCLAGVGQVAKIVLACAIAGGVLALALMVLRRRVGRTLGNVWLLVRHHLLFGVQSHPEINLDSPEAIRLPYALAIAAGTFYSLGAMLMQR